MLAALAFATAELGFDQVHSAEAHGEKDQRDEHSNGHALKESEENDRDEDQQDDEQVLARQSPTVLGKPSIEHRDAGEDDDPGSEWHRDRLH